MPLVIFGGVVGYIIFACTLVLTRGLSHFDYLAFLGAESGSSAEANFVRGFWLVFILGALILPSILWVAWRKLPWEGTGLGTALLKGLLFGLVCWIVAGVTIPIFQESAAGTAGFFGLSLGIVPAALLLVACLMYGVATVVVGMMTRGTSPIDMVGWKGLGP